MRTSYIFKLNREVSLAELDNILTNVGGKSDMRGEIDMAEGDHLWLSATDPLYNKWQNLCKEETFDTAYVNIYYEEWDDPKAFIDDVKYEIERLNEEPTELVDEPTEEEKEEVGENKEVEEEVEILDFYMPENDEIKATKLSRFIIYNDELENYQDTNDYVVIVRNIEIIKPEIQLEVVNSRECYYQGEMTVRRNL